MQPAWRGRFRRTVFTAMARQIPNDLIRVRARLPLISPPCGG